MISAAVLCTVIFVAITLLIGVFILLYQHYRYRRKSMDWGDIARYDTPLEILPPGSNNSSFRSYKYSQLIGPLAKQGEGGNQIQNHRKFSNSHLYPPQRPCLSLGDIENNGRRSGGTRSSTRSCPPGVVYMGPSQSQNVAGGVIKEQQLVQPYYYYRQVIHPSVSTKARHSLPEVILSPPPPTPSPSPSVAGEAEGGESLRPSPANSNPNSKSNSPTHHHRNSHRNRRRRSSPKRQLQNPYTPSHHRNNFHNSSYRAISQNYHHNKPKLSVDYCFEPIPVTGSASPSTRTSPTRRSKSRRSPSKCQNLPHVKVKSSSRSNPGEDHLNLRAQGQFEALTLNIETETGGDQDLEYKFQNHRQSFPSYAHSNIPSSYHQYQPSYGRRYSTTYFTENEERFPIKVLLSQSTLQDDDEEEEQEETMLTHQSRSLPTGPPIPGARLNRTFSISSQGHIENAARKGHRGSSPAIRTFNPDGCSFDVTSPPDSPPTTYHGSRSPSPLYVRAASLDINRTGSPCHSQLEAVIAGATATQHSSQSMDSYPSGKVPMLSPNSLCVRRASRCLSPLYIPPISPKSPTDGNSSSSQPSASSIGPISPMLGSLQLDLYLKKDLVIYIDAYRRINKVKNGTGGGGNKKDDDEPDSVNFPFPSVTKANGKINGHRSLGRLHFRLKYDLDKSDLNLHVIEATDLAKGDQGGFNDPYIRIFLSPEVDSRKRETNIHQNESSPFFDQQFKFPVSQEDLKEKTLTLQVLDNDKYSRNDVVGEVVFALEDFDVTTNLEIWAEIIQNKQPSGERQEISISLSYLPSAERLTVVLLKARNLHPPDNKDTIDPFVKVYLLGGGKRQKKKKTTARKNSNNPMWNEAFTFSIPSANLNNCSLEISVLDQSNDLMGSHALIGACMIGPHQNGSELTHWQEMTHNLRNTITMWHVLT